MFSRHISMTLPASFRGKNATRPDYENQNSNLYAISGESLPPGEPVGLENRVPGSSGA